jgi:hypothetical protein
VDLTGTFKIDQPKLTTMNKNMRRLAIAPDPAGRMHPGKNWCEPFQNFFRSSPIGPFRSRGFLRTRLKGS